MNLRVPSLSVERDRSWTMSQILRRVLTDGNPRAISSFLKRKNVLLRVLADQDRRARNALGRDSVNVHDARSMPMKSYPKPPYPAQRQPMPGSTRAMDPRPDHGESSYKGSGRLLGKKAIITGGDSGIGRAVAIAYAREGADLVIAYLNEDEDAAEVKALVEDEGRKAVLIPGDLSDPEHCRAIVRRAVEELGGLDI